MMHVQGRRREYLCGANIQVCVHAPVPHHCLIERGVYVSKRVNLGDSYDRF